MVTHVLFAIVLVKIALAIGMLGYHWLGGLNWVHSLYEAFMILSGMGPFNKLESNVAKIFASVCALFSGLAFIALVGIILSPVAHRMLHIFHSRDENA
ncbi:MAG: hypothetical protein ABIM42_03260 [candidate division WOR-3 bacterium]